MQGSPGQDSAARQHPQVQVVCLEVAQIAVAEGLDELVQAKAVLIRHSWTESRSFPFLGVCFGFAFGKKLLGGGLEVYPSGKLSEAGFCVCFVSGSAAPGTSARFPSKSGAKVGARSRT